MFNPKVNKANLVRNVCLSFVPQTKLFLRHVIREQMALPAGLDAATIGHRRVFRLPLALTVLKAARVPPHAQF